MNLNLTLKNFSARSSPLALLSKSEPVNFSSPEQERMITMWILSTPTLQETRNGWRMRDYEILRTASAVEAVKCLADIWGADERMEE